MAYEIIMPVLGMSQDTGIIASWCKSLGDYVNAGEAIMEVETDKAIQEIEAAESGYLSKIFHQQDAKVPGGEVVGLLTAEKLEDLGEDAAQPPDSGSEIPLVPPKSGSQNQTCESKGEALPDSKVITDKSSPPLQKEGAGEDFSLTLALASGKARGLAHKHQLSLKKVSAALGKNPLNAADITTYLELPVSNETTEQALASGSLHTAVVTTTQMAFRVSRAGLKHCESWLSKQQAEGHELTSSHLIATLASGLWRDMVAEDSTAPVTVNVECATSDGFSQTQLLDADLQRFSRLSIVTEENAIPANLQLIDLRHSTLCEYQPGTFAQPLLVVAKDKKYIKVSFYGISEAQNSPALRLMDTLARQLEEPLIYIA